MSGKDTKYKVKRFEGPLTLLEVGVRRAHRLLVYHNSHWYAIYYNSHWYARYHNSHWYAIDHNSHWYAIYYNSHWYAIDQNSHWYARATQAAAHIPDLTPGSQA